MYNFFHLKMCIALAHTISLLFKIQSDGDFSLEQVI